MHEARSGRRLGLEWHTAHPLVLAQTRQVESIAVTNMERMEHFFVTYLPNVVEALRLVADAEREGDADLAQIAEALHGIAQDCIGEVTEPEAREAVRSSIDIARRLTDLSGAAFVLGDEVITTLKMNFGPSWVPELTREDERMHARARAVALALLQSDDWTATQAVALAIKEDRLSSMDTDVEGRVLERLCQLHDRQPLAAVGLHTAARVLATYVSRPPLPGRGMRVTALLSGLALLQHADPGEWVLDVEADAWRHLFVCCPLTVGWEAALFHARDLAARVPERLAAVAAWCPAADGDTWTSARGLLLGAVDGLVAVRRRSEAVALLRACQDLPAWAHLAASPDGDDLDALVVALNAADKDNGFPPPGLLQELISRGCHRSASLLVLLALEGRSDDLPNPAGVFDVELAIKACMADWNPVLARCFYPHVRGILARIAVRPPPVERNNDVQLLNEVSRELAVSHLCERLYGPGSDWHALDPRAEIGAIRT